MLLTASVESLYIFTYRGVAHIFIFDARVFMQPGRRRGIAAQMQHNKAPLLTHCPPVISPLSLLHVICYGARSVDLNGIYVYACMCSLCRFAANWIAAAAGWAPFNLVCAPLVLCSGYCTLLSLELFQLIELSAHAHRESIKRTAKFLVTYEGFDYVFQRWNFLTLS
jgi:hypothetical protein